MTRGPDRCPRRGRPSQFVERLAVPCTPSELAASFDLTLRSARAYLYSLKRRGKAVRTDTKIPCGSKRGRPWEYLWRAA